MTDHSPDHLVLLYVDDDPDFRDLVDAFVDRLATDVTVHTADSTAAAEDRIAAADCVLADYDLPDADGEQLIDRLRADRPDLPVVFYTHHTSLAARSAAASAGADGFYEKRATTTQFEVILSDVRALTSPNRRAGHGSPESIGASGPGVGTLGEERAEE